MPTENLTRTYRRGSETGLSGSEAIVVENGLNLDQTISASTEEEVTAAFTARLLRSIMIVCDTAVPVEFLETRYAILQTAAAAPDTVTFTGDLTGEIRDGDLIRVEGTVADDGRYQVEGVAVGAGTTTITLADGNVWPVAGGGAVGTFAKIASQNRVGHIYDIATATAATDVLTITGDITDQIAAGDFILINDSTGNDGIWSVTLVTELAGVTSITVTEYNDIAVPVGIADNTNDGNIQKVWPYINLAANLPFMWSRDQGLQNPFIQTYYDEVANVWFEFDIDLGDVVAIMVDNTGTASAAAFDGRIGYNSNIFP